MNPQWHDEFVALCALYASGELTEEEWALLQVHLAYCEPCRVTFDQYQQLAESVVPVLASSAYAAESELQPSSFSLESAERKLMERIDALPREQQKVHPRHLLRNVSLLLLAACTVCVAGFAGLHFGHSGRDVKTEKSLKPADTIALAPVRKDQPVAGSAEELAKANSEVAKLSQELREAQDRSRESVSSASSVQQQLTQEQSERRSLSDDRESLAQQLAVARAEVQALREKSLEENTSTAKQATRIAALEVKLNELNSTIETKDRLLALDKGLLDHDREIRDLIGARDLYITDIFDVAQNGKTKEPFGRVFYTKDRSLVFYGYDLDKQAGLKQSVTFQAWGSGDDKENVSLGLFYQDDTHKRWILRFNDTKTLARLNMVFVTAEPQGGSVKPTGKPLLLAYLQVRPNHP